MKGKSCVGKSIALCFGLSLIFVQSAHAYLDPGTGSAILQGILAAIVVIGITAKLFWHRLIKLLRIRKDNGLDKKEVNLDKR